MMIYLVSNPLIITSMFHFQHLALQVLYRLPYSVIQIYSI